MKRLGGMRTGLFGWVSLGVALAPVAARAEDDEVQVVGSSIAKNAGSVHVVRSAELERFEYDDPQAILTRVPGVYGRQEDGVGLRPNIGMRGVNPDRSKKVTLMEDGILFAPAPYSAPAAYYFPLFTRMSQIRVAKGVGSIVYGPQTIGGAIDALTRPIPRDAFGGGVDLAAGDYGYAKFHGFAGTGNEQMGALVEGVHLTNTGFKNLPGGADTGSYRNEWMLKTRYMIDPRARIKHELQLKLGYSDEASNETYLGLSDADFRTDPRHRYPTSALDRMQWHRTSLAATHVMDVGDLTITTTAYRHDLARSWRKVNGFRGASAFDVLRDPEIPRNAVYYELLRGRASSSTLDERLLVGPNQRDFVSQGIETRVRLAPRLGPTQHRIEYGARLHYDRIERRHSEDAFVVDGPSLQPTGEPAVVTAFNEAATHAFAGWVSDAITWKALTVTPGVRVEAMRSVFADKFAGTTTGLPTQVLLPGVGAHYMLLDSFGVLAGVHRGFSPPTPGTDARAQPELSVNYEAGARFMRGRTRVEAIGFYNDYSNLTDVCTLSSGCVEANLDRQFDAGRARIYGLEAFAEHDVSLPRSLRLPLSASYTLTQSEFLRDFTSDDPIFGAVKAGFEMPYVPRHQLSATAGVEHPRAGGAVTVMYVSRMREAAGGGAFDPTLTTDEQFIVDLAAHSRVVGPVSLYANARNLFDAQYIVSRRPYGARPNAPRWLQMGVKVDF